MTRAEDRVLEGMTRHGCAARIVKACRAANLRGDILELGTENAVDKEFYKERLGSFDFKIPDDAHSLIVVAVPRPQSQAIFSFGGQTLALILPPTYVAYDRTRKWVENTLSDHLRPDGYSVKRALLPLKLLAAQSGLCHYGRNNICYVDGMGSFFELVACFSDMPCEDDHWQKPEMMPTCENCQACRSNCPTGAISNDRFLLRAERCLVYHNEKNGSIPFPKWIDHSWHNCLVGCMRCQSVCPQDKKFMNWIVEKEEFSEEETILLLNETSKDRLPEKTAQKLANLDLLEDVGVLPRNLRVFLSRVD